MKTLLVSHHRNGHQDYGRNPDHSTTKFGSFGSPPSGNFSGIDCWTSKSSTGLVRTPSGIPIINRVFSSSFKPETPSPSVKDSLKKSKINAKSSSTPMPIRIMTRSEHEDSPSGKQMHFSDLWAGPAYSQSPPPSSVPMPKFSMQPKRTVSLDLPDLPTSPSEIDVHPTAKSAPASPTAVQSPPSGNMFDISDSATKTLRRILNLDNVDE